MQWGDTEMCGISGIVDLRADRPIDEALLKRMNDRQAHRGPDGDGYHFEPGVGLGHRRLSIIDLEGGAQPMFNEDNSVVVTYNGEIYEFASLMEELRAAGHRFRTRCDTEVIVHAWEEWGNACLERLHGMFAFAIWDRNRQSLFLARDRFGKKPLYYTYLDDGHFAFASELKVLLQHPLIDRTISATAVEDYMTFGYVPDPNTIFRRVHKLPPAHYLLLERGKSGVEPRPYWDIAFANPDNSIPLEGLIPELQTRLRDATAKRMIADVPLGAFLSGGVDSSAVVAMMSDISDAPVNTCSISFGDPAYNESKYAEQLADRYGTAHHVEQVNADDFSLVERIPSIYDEPFADSSSIPTFRVCELARKHVKVALSGDGGDEVFAGYRRYRWHMNEERLRQSVPPFLRRNLFGALGALYPKLDWAPRIFRAKSTLEAIARDSMEAYLHSVSILPNDLHGKLFSPSFRRELQGYTSREVFRQHEARCDTDDPLSRIQYIDMKTYLPGDILTKVDRASMANSLEVRVPLLDAEFATWAGSIPSSMKLQGRQGKFVFKKALEGIVPNDILYREKMGFAVPLTSWFRGPLRERVRERLLGESMRECGIFDLEYVESILDQHVRGSRDHSPPIWALLVFEGFYRNLRG
jgi:asparagine synthase (glutamine-hydrolysing)